MQPFVAELIGTAFLILFGNGVVANVVLTGTKGNGAGWLAIAAGWGIAVYNRQKDTEGRALSLRMGA